MQVHEERAVEIARNCDTAKPCTIDARQGDVILRRVADANRRLSYGPTPAGGIVISAGAHGEHRLIADAYADGGPGFAELQSDGLLVHTDTPSGRHAAMRLAPGRWECGQIRELGLDLSIQKVRD